MRHGSIDTSEPGWQLVASRWDRLAARARDLLCLDESRQHATVVCACSIHTGASEAACVVAGVERAAGRADFLCGLRLSDHVDEPAAMEEPGAGLRCRLLPIALCAHRAAARGAAGDPEPAAPGACAAFRCEAGDGRIGTRAGGGADLPRESARGKTRIPAG